MGRHPLSSFRRGTTLLAIAVLAASGPSACGVAGPSPDRHREESGTLAPGSAPGSEPRQRTHLVLRVGERRLYLMDDNPETPVESFPVAVGRAGSETPTGRFQVEEMVESPEFLKMDSPVTLRVLKRFPPGPANPLGERWIGFAHGEGWTVGFHGTPNPELLGRAVSGGCVRMRNADVVRVYDRVQLGTTVIVEP